jgi:hypothetical protein
MPLALERKLRAQAKRLHLSPERADAYVYGTLRKTGWRPEGQGTTVARAKRHGILSMFHIGRRRSNYDRGHGYDNEQGGEIKRRGVNRRVTRAAHLREYTSAGAEERRVYSRKYRRGGWGFGYLFKKNGEVRRHKGVPIERKPRIKLSPEERKEEQRLAARRRYHAKHPGAKYRTGLGHIAEKNQERDLIHPIYSEFWGVGADRKMRRLGPSKFRRR